MDWGVCMWVHIRVVVNSVCVAVEGFVCVKVVGWSLQWDHVPTRFFWSSVCAAVILCVCVNVQPQAGFRSAVVYRCVASKVRLPPLLALNTFWVLTASFLLHHHSITPNVDHVSHHGSALLTKSPPHIFCWVCIANPLLKEKTVLCLHLNQLAAGCLLCRCAEVEVGEAINCRWSHSAVAQRDQRERTH